MDRLVLVTHCGSECGRPESYDSVSIYALQFDWCAWVPNTPCTMRQPPPRDKDAVTMETIMATLPDISQSCMQMAITWHLGRPQPDAVSLSLSVHLSIRPPTYPSIHPVYRYISFPLSRFHWATTARSTSQRPRPASWLTSSKKNWEKLRSASSNRMREQSLHTGSSCPAALKTALLYNIYCIRQCSFCFVNCFKSPN